MEPRTEDLSLDELLGFKQLLGSLSSLRIEESPFASSNETKASRPHSIALLQDRAAAAFALVAADWKKDDAALQGALSFVESLQAKGIKGRKLKLSDSELREAEALIHAVTASEVISKYSAHITTRDLSCLRDGVWLGDEVMNFFCNMLLDRNRKLVASNPKYPKSFFYNTFFFAKLSTDGYNAVKRWSKRANVEIAKQDKVFIPININNTHWACACINLRDKQFEFYDSLGGNGATILNKLRDFLKEEIQTHSNTTIDVAGWTNFSPKDIPHQRNGCDCGVFALMYAWYLSEDLPLTFSQDDMPNIRRLIALYIKRGEIADN